MLRLARHADATGYFLSSANRRISVIAAAAPTMGTTQPCSARRPPCDATESHPIAGTRPLHYRLPVPGRESARDALCRRCRLASRRSTRNNAAVRLASLLSDGVDPGSVQTLPKHPHSGDSRPRLPMTSTPRSWQSTSSKPWHLRDRRPTVIVQVESGDAAVGDSVVSQLQGVVYRHTQHRSRVARRLGGLTTQAHRQVREHRLAVAVWEADEGCGCSSKAANEINLTCYKDASTT